MEAGPATEQDWGGTALNNPANVTHSGWRKADIADQTPLLRRALLLGKIDPHDNPFTLRAKDGGDVFLTSLECLGVAGLGDTQVRRFLAWAEADPGAVRNPSAHWRIAYYLTANDDGTVDLDAVHVAPDCVAHRSRPRPPLPI